MATPRDRDTPEAWHAARVAGARAVVKISGKLGKPVDPDVVRLAAEADPPRGERRAS